MTQLIDHFVIDPPWPRKKGGKRAIRPMQSRELDYSTMSVPEIFALLDKDVFVRANSPCNVFLWSIDRFLHEGEAEMAARGFKPHARFVWDKGNGVAPAFTVRYTHEYLCWFYRPTLLPIATNQRGKFTTIIRAPGREHSRKPDECYAMIDALYPNAVKMDVFSREKRDGWIQYGNETDKFAPQSESLEEDF